MCEAGVILAYAGRRATSPEGDLPPEAMVRLAARVGRLLDALRPAAVVGAAAAGTDLVVLEAAVQRGIAAEVVLPAGRSEFRASSVADLGGLWPRRYDELLDAAGVTVHQHRLVGDSGWRYLAGNEAILARAAELSGAETGPAAALGVLGRTRDGTDVTAAFLTAAADRGLVTVRLHPRTGEVAVDGRAYGVLAEGIPDDPPGLLPALRDEIATP
jgi:hypothetical protein